MIEDTEEPKLKQAASTMTAMPAKVTMKGGLFLSDLQGAESAFDLENRYAAYTADRRKVMKKKKPDDLSKSMHDEPNSFHIKTDDAPLGSSSSHGFFDYHFHKESEKNSQNNTVRRGRRRFVPLRAKSLDSDDAAALASAMEQLKKYRNDDNSSSSDSDDSSFTSDLCHYHKEMAAKTNFIKTETVKGFTMIGQEANEDTKEPPAKESTHLSSKGKSKEMDRSWRSSHSSKSTSSTTGKSREMDTSKRSTVSTEGKSKNTDCPRRSRRVSSTRANQSKCVDL